MYQIGVFSKICHVSVKTLRHYDKIGLLKPVKVDRFTGYRYYNQTQLERMLLIQRLKRYGFSLEEARTLLDCDSRSTVRAKLLEQKQILERAQMETGLILQELSAHLRSLERTGDLMAYQKGYEIRLTETPERPVLSCRENMGVDEFFKYYGPLYERLARDRTASRARCTMTRNFTGSLPTLRSLWESGSGNGRIRYWRRVCARRRSTGARIRRCPTHTAL